MPLIKGKITVNTELQLPERTELAAEQTDELLLLDNNSEIYKITKENFLSDTEVGLEVPTIIKTIAANGDYFIGIDSNDDLYKITKVNLLSGLSSGSGGSYPDSFTHWHDESVVISGGSIAIDLNATYHYQTVGYQLGGLQNDSFKFTKDLQSGIYDLKISHHQSFNRGKLKLEIDGVLAFDDFDCYNGSDISAVITRSITINSNGSHEFKFTVYGKNASASGYYALLTKFWARKTASIDPNDYIFLLHFDGTNNSNVFIDEAGNTVTPTNAIISTGQSKFNGSSGYFNDAAYLSIPGSTDFNFTGNFCIEFFVRFASLPGSNDFATFIDIDGYDSGLRMGWFNYSTKWIEVFIANTEYQFPWLPVVDTWYFVRLTRQSGNLKCWVDGVQIGTTKTNNTSIVSTNNGVKIGAEHPNGFYKFHGWIDEMRIRTGVFDENEPVPTEPFPN